MRQNVIYALFGGVLVLALAGCSSTKIANMGALQSVRLQPAEVLPTESELASRPPRVVVFDITDKYIRSSRGSGVTVTLQHELEKYLSAAGVEIVDRGAATKLHEELVLAEAKGVGLYRGPDVVDYAILGTISNTSTNSRFKEAYTTEYKGEVTRHPARCYYAGSIAASFRIYKMPSMQPMQTLSLEGTTKSSEETRTSRCSLSERDSHNLIRRAAAVSLDSDNGVALQNIFAASGYISDYRRNEDIHAFKVTLGSSRGAREGVKVEILKRRLMRNPLTGKDDIEKLVVAEGVISDQVATDHAWILIKDPDRISRIRLGHEVKLKFDRNWWSGLSRIVGGSMP